MAEHRFVNRTLALAVVLGVAGGDARAQTTKAGNDDRWHFSIAPYFWAAGMEGEVSVRGVPEVPVKASFGDIWDALDFAMLAHFEARKNRWGFGTDVVYMNLGADVASSTPILGRLDLSVDQRQTLAEGFAFYRATEWESSSGRAGFLDALAGLRYVSTSVRIEGSEFEGTKRTLDWVDGLVGLRTFAPIGRRFGIVARGDVAGLGSDFSLNLVGNLTFDISDRWTLGVGYRYLSIDYDKDEGADRKLYDVDFDGPLFGVSYSW